MKLYDGGKILTGLILFLVLLTFPVWYTLAIGKASPAPELELPADAEQCVAATEYIRVNHMSMLREWRDLVIREGDRVYTDPTGKNYERSLTKTCLSCHASKANFCDRCHNYSGVVNPYCWECHIVPEELQ